MQQTKPSTAFWQVTHLHDRIAKQTEAGLASLAVQPGLDPRALAHAVWLSNEVDELLQRADARAQAVDWT